jgi:transaldolase/transaldolase/glucose-6-phosphate isomerase
MAGMNDLLALGQSVWLDFIRRAMVRDGRLEALVRQGLRGLTSNPAIFEKAVAGGDEYDDDLRSAIRAHPDANGAALFEVVAIQDIREAADLLRGVYESSGGRDGFVSLEVSPHIAHDSAATVADARRLWWAVGRPNLMIKVPATPEGVRAIEQLTGEGINVNATLLFSLTHYEGVAGAYLRGLARSAHPESVASVASFFVSRVDTLIDKHLDRLATPEAAALRGRAAVANAKLAWHRFNEIFHGSAFEPLRRRGAHAQRVLYGSTSTKDPAYPDVKYVEELIGPETVNTVPPETLEAFLDHGRARSVLESGVEEAHAALAALEPLGIDMGEVTEFLQRDGVQKFADAYDKLLAALEAKRDRFLSKAGR